MKEKRIAGSYLFGIKLDKVSMHHFNWVNFIKAAFNQITL